MKKLLLTFLLCLIPFIVNAAATERGFTIEYTEPSFTACRPSTQLKPTSAPTMCLEALGSEAQQNTCNNTKNQRFEMMPAGIGLFQLKSQMTNLCLRMGAIEDDAIIETSCANAAAGGGGAQDQIFRIGPSPSKIQSNTGAGGLCLDVGGASQAAGHKIQSYPCHGGSNQLFAYTLSAGGDCPLDDLAGTKVYMEVILDGGGGAPALTSPTPGATLTTSSVAFQWSAGSGVDEYWLGVGTSQDAVDNSPYGDIFAESTETNTSQVVSGIPLTGNPVFVRLWWKIGGTWSSVDYTYQTHGGGGGTTDTVTATAKTGDRTTDTVAATAKTGGGKISKKYCVTILDDATALAIEIEVTAFDESGNESERTPKLIHPVLGTRDCTPPDTTPPAGVENLSIQ